MKRRYRVFAVKGGIRDKVTAVLGGFQATNMLFCEFGKGPGIVGIPTYRLHINGYPGLSSMR